jgi:ketosteroid isomerase-like protein
VSANLDLVRSIFQAWTHGDIEIVVREYFEPTARLDLSENIFNPAVYEGYEAIARQRRGVNDVWDQFEVEVERLFECEGAVVAFMHERVRGEASGVEVDRDTAFLFRLRDGKVTEVRGYRDRDRALADLGRRSAFSPIWRLRNC